MEKRIKKILLSIVAILLVLGLIFFAFYYSNQAAISIDETEHLYNEAIKSNELGFREKALNETLSNYLHIEKEYHPIFGNGKLYNNIAETYYQLGSFPESVFYFYQAKALRPLDAKVQNNLTKALSQLNIVEEPKRSFWQAPFFFHYNISLPVRLQILFFLTLSIFFLASVFLWKKWPLLKNILFFLVFFNCLILASVLYNKYFEPIEAVVITSVMLRSNHAINASYVDQNPINSGHLVEVLDVIADGEWLKIRFQEKIGFVPSKNVKLLY